MESKKKVEAGEPVQEIKNVPLVGGPNDGGVDDALISDGELCGKVYFSPFLIGYCHTYNLTYNHDDGFKLVYIGIKPFTVKPDGTCTVEE